MKIRVYYEDTDAGGIVYHTNYIKYCERARSEVFFSKDMKPMSSQSSGFVVSSLNASYHAPAVLGDMLTVRTDVLSIKKVQTTLLQEVYRDGKKLFSMQIKLVFMDKGKICKIPDSIFELLDSF